MPSCLARITALAERFSSTKAWEVISPGPRSSAKARFKRSMKVEGAGGSSFINILVAVEGGNVKPGGVVDITRAKDMMCVGGIVE